MFSPWENFLYFHLQPAVIDGLLTLLAVLIFMYLFRIRDPALRSLFLFLPLVRPPIIIVEGASQAERLPLQEGMMLGLRFPDPFKLFPDNIFGSQERISTVSMVAARIMLIALFLSLAFFFMRWACFILFYHRLEKKKGLTCGPERVRANLAINSLCKEMGYHRLPQLLLLRRSKWTTPCTIGWRFPKIVIESDLVSSLDDDELRAILAHEIGHVLRRDGLWRWVSVVLRDIQYFNPFSHICMSKLEMEREKACDSIAVRQGKVNPRILAKCLIKVSQIFLLRDTQPFPGHSVSLLGQKRCSLEDRVTYLLGMHVINQGGGFRRSRLRIPKLLLATMFWVSFATLQMYVCILMSGYALVIM